MEELSVLLPDTDRFKLADGTHVEVEDLKLRQFLKMLRIITKSSLPLILDGGLFRKDDDSDEFARQLMTILLLAIPDAEDETCEFLRSCVRPAGLIVRPTSKSDNERNAFLKATLNEKLANPELEDTVSIFEVIIRREAKDIQALGKRLKAMWMIASKTGLLSRKPPSTTASSADSPAASTSSVTSTAGTTNVVWDSPFDGSGSASSPSESVASTNDGAMSNG